MSQRDDEDMNSSLERVEMAGTVRGIFDGIVNEPMKQFQMRLEFIKENRFGDVWRDDTERHEKVMSHARSFIQAIAASFPCKHAEAAEHIEESICELFLEYIHEVLHESLLSENLFDESYSETKELISRKMWKMKELLEAKHDDTPNQKSELQVMISKTELFDPIHIHHALLCCQIAYNCQNPEYIENCLENLDKKHLLSQLSVSYENEHVPKYVMARCGDVLYVSFKGVKSHLFEGTNTSYRGEILKAVLNAAEKIPLKYFARAFINKQRIVFSGHSTGGAIACLVLTFLLEKFKQLENSYLQFYLKCITFGVIPIADSMFRKYVEAIPGERSCFCHIVQKNDIVPKLFGLENITYIENSVWQLVEHVVKRPLEILSTEQAFSNVTAHLNRVLKHARDFWRSVTRGYLNRQRFDTFGTYYFIEASASVKKYHVASGEQLRYFLTIKDSESVWDMLREYLINHNIERYVHEVELVFLQELPDFKKYESSCSTAIVEDTAPEIEEVRFENIGEEVVAKIAGAGMWFVYNVSIDGVNGDGKDLEVNVKKSSESEVQTRMREASIVHTEAVSVRVKTHFQNSKYLPAKEVPAKTTTYPVTRRQQQLAKHRPHGVIELAYLSALLERHHGNYSSKRYKAIEAFLKNAVSVVPLESLFHAIANGKQEVMLQCCEIFSTGDAIQSINPISDFLISLMKNAVQRIRHFQSITIRYVQNPDEVYRVERYPFLTERQEMSEPMCVREDSEELRLRHRQQEGDDYYEGYYSGTGRGIRERRQKVDTVQRSHFELKELNNMLNGTVSNILPYVTKYKNNGKQRVRQPVCKINLDVIYPSTSVRHASESKVYCRAPMTLLKEGRKELTSISEKLVAEQSGYTEQPSSSNRNSMMLKVLNDIRKEFETASTLLGTFMEAQVQIPLEKVGGDKYVNEFAKHARSFGLSVWGLLVLPFSYLDKIIGLSSEFGQFVIEFSDHIRKFHRSVFHSSEHQFPDYDEKLEFLVGSMKQSWTSNQKYVSYSLERQLQDQCKKRNIFHDTPVDEILNQWNNNFEDETLTLVPDEYRPLVARWIKWSLMINNLRETLASQTAVGVIGLVNSGKSKFVRSLFGEETITGTTDEKRTTVPLIYNLGQNVMGLDVIDFPGVDDRDKSIPELAKLLMSLTRIIIFVVDYRRAHTESTKEWLSILEKEKVPVLVCLSFADKLYAELMGENGDRDAEKVKAGVANQLNTIKEQIGSPKRGHQRDLKLTVFAFDNDSKLNTNEGKEKLRKAGLSDELDVGRWIAEKLEDCEQNDVSQNVIKFIEGKAKSTLNSNINRLSPVAVPATEEENGDAQVTTTDVQSRESSVGENQSLS